MNSSHHLLRDCTLLATHRVRLLLATVGDIKTSEFIINASNLPPLHRFLKATGLGHTKHLSFDLSPTTDDNESDRSESPEPDFGGFEH
jgi:hypothetical protein